VAVGVVVEDKGLVNGGGGGSRNKREREGETTRDTTVRDNEGRR